MKPAVLVSIFSAVLTFLFVLDQTVAVAGQRALLVFTGVFLWSYLAFFLMSRVLPKGVDLFSSGGIQVDGKGSDKMVDLEKQTIDRTKLEELLR